MARRISVVGLALLVAIPLIAGRTAGAEQSDGAVVLEDADVREYARQFQVPEAEARRRLSLQPLVGDLQAALMMEEATFAGLWIDNGPEYTVRVAFTRDARDTLQRHTRDTPLDAVAVPVSVTHSLLELEVVQARLHELNPEPFDSGETCFFFSCNDAVYVATNYIENGLGITIVTS